MDSLGECFAIPQFLSDTLKDNHIRVYGHTYGKYNTRNTWEGKYGVDTHQDTEHKENVEEQSNISKYPCTAIVEEHPEEDDNSRNGERDKSAGDGFLS